MRSTGADCTTEAVAASAARAKIIEEEEFVIVVDVVVAVVLTFVISFVVIDRCFSCCERCSNLVFKLRARCCIHEYTRGIFYHQTIFCFLTQYTYIMTYL